MYNNFNKTQDILGFEVMRRSFSTEVLPQPRKAYAELAPELTIASFARLHCFGARSMVNY